MNKSAVILLILHNIAQAQSTSFTANSCQPENSLLDIQGSPRSALDDQRVLLLGDSQVAGAFGDAMASHLTAAGVTYFVKVGHSGWGVIDWLRNRIAIQHIIERHQPTLVLISLGGNDWFRSNDQEYQTHVREFWNFIIQVTNENAPANSHTSFVWISPASTVGRHANIQRQRTIIANIILQVVGSNHYAESQDITNSLGRTPDGIHFTYRGANSWAHRLIPRIETSVRRQIQTRIQ